MEIPGYVIDKVIGKGGMARVYLAHHKALDRKVAIKVMNRQQQDNSDYNDRFIREARIVANLTHPNIITIHDVGENDGHNYLVMEFLPDSQTLKDKIKAGVDSQSALSIVRQVATALKVAHEKNIVHRDIKPDNIMFRTDGSVVLMDFGVARSIDASATQMTQAGLIIGTPRYISPEQAKGEEVGPYSDIYSLGVVFYEMLTGNVPYNADTPLALALKHASEPVPLLPGEYAAYQPLLDRMMAKARDQRYSNCDDIIVDIDNITAGKPAAHATQIMSASSADKTVMDKTIIDQAAVDNMTLVIDSKDSVPVNKPQKEKRAKKISKEKKGPEKKSKAATSTQVWELETMSTDQPKKSNTFRNALIGSTLGLVIAGGVYAFIGVDVGKLKTMVGLEAGPVYSRVGQLITVPAGSYNMGNRNGDSSERPVRTVRVNGFKLGETEVTQKQWRTVMGTDSSYFKGCDDCPVDSVSWNDAQLFLKKINQQTGLSFRLPTEAEWEYACRSAGKKEKYCGGSDESKLAWYGDNSKQKTHAVAQKQANGLGIHDMSGNVWEWTQDCWHDSYDGAPSSSKAWEKDACKQRVLRGGSWIGVAGGLSSTGRLASQPHNGSRNIGFRVALDL
jgi:serine/threonine protein kinase